MNNKTDISQDSSQLKTETPQKPLTRSITIATIIMMSSVLLSRVIGLFREMVLASFGGTSSDMDVYVTSFLLPELLNHFLAGGFLSITFIPIFQRYLHKGTPEKAWRSFSNLISVGTVVFVVSTVFIQLYTPSVLSLLGKRISDPAQLALTSKLTRIILPAQIFFYWGAFFSAVQMAQQRFLFPALAPLVYNFGIIAGGMILGPRIGIEGFAWGVLFGAFAANVLLQLPGALSCGMKFNFTFNIKDPDFREYITKTVPLIAGLGMTFSNEIFFRIFGSILPQGATSSINYALRTMMIITAVFGQASGTAFYPFLVKLATEKNYSKMTELVNSVLKKIAIYLIPLSVIMIVLSPQIISLLFERGKFTSESTHRAAGVLMFYLIGSFSFSSSMIVSRLFYALQNTLLPMLISTGAALLSIPLYLIFCSIAGAKGIAMAATIAMTIQFVTLVLIWYSKYDSLQTLKRPLFRFAQIIIASAAAVPLIMWLRSFGLTFHYPSLLLKNLIICTGSSLPALMLIFVLYQIFGIERMGKLVKGLLRR